MKKRNALIVTLGYIIGIIWGLYCKCNIAFLYIFTIAIFYIINQIKRKKHKFKIISLSRYLKYLKIFINSNTLIILTIASLVSNILVNKINNKYENLYKGKEQIDVIATVISNPKIKNKTSLYTIKIENLENKKKFKNTKLILKVKENSKLKYGDKIKVIGTFQEPSIQRNYGGFDYKEYLKTNKIYGTIKAESIEKIGKNNSNYILKLSNNLFLKIKSNIEKIYSKEKASIMLGIMLGYTDDIEEDIKENFKISNISHVLAVSGMHIMYIVAGISFLLNDKLGKRKTKIITIIVLIIYMFITGFSPSIVRAGIMGIITLFSSIIHRKKDIPTTIAISLLIILVYNPFLITSASVLFSYLGTIGIIIFSENILKILKKIRIKSKKIKYRINKNILKLDLKIKSILSVSISVQIFIIPIMINLYNTISMSVLITNLSMSFIIGIIVLLGFGQIISLFISINVAKILSLIINFFLDILIQISKWGNVLPLSKIYITTPNLLTIIFYYMMIIIINYIFTICSSKDINESQRRIKNLLNLFKYNLNKNKENIYKIIAIVSMVLVIYFIFPRNLRIYFIDVGQGDSTLIKTPLNKVILIDGGGSLNDDFDIGKNTLLPYLLDRKVKTIDYMIISHMDQDHIGGLFYLMENINVKKIIIGKQAENSENFKKLLKIVDDENIKLVEVEAESRIDIEKNIYFDVFWPDCLNFISDNAINNNALVCKLYYNSFSILFTGDIEKEAEENILKQYKNTNKLKSTVLKVAHHGSKSSSTEEFLQAVNPKYALIRSAEKIIYLVIQVVKL